MNKEEKTRIKEIEEYIRLHKEKKKIDLEIKKQQYKFEEQRFSFYISDNDLDGFSAKQKKEFERFLDNLRENKKLSSWIKNAIIEKFLNQKTIEFESQKIINELNKQKEDEYEKLAIKIVDLLVKNGITYDNSITDKVQSGEKLSKTDIEKILNLE